MDEANNTLAPGQDAQPSRLIIEVKNPADATIAQYFQTHHYETEGNGLDDGKAAWFLRLLTGIVSTVGGVICLLAFYLLSLSIFLLLQKNATKLENLLLPPSWRTCCSWATLRRKWPSPTRRWPSD